MSLTTHTPTVTAGMPLRIETERMIYVDLPSGTHSVSQTSTAAGFVMAMQNLNQDDIDRLDFDELGRQLITQVRQHHAELITELQGAFNITDDDDAASAAFALLNGTQLLDIGKPAAIAAGYGDELEMALFGIVSFKQLGLEALLKSAGVSMEELSGDDA